MDFFTADPHLNHGNIIRYCNRPFANVDEMNDTIISNWNRKVTPKDRVFVLGDFVFQADPTQFIKRLNGEIVLIRGNHDHKKRVFNRLYSFVHDIYVYKPKNIVLCHYAMLAWPGRHHGAYHLFGHSHGTLVDPPIRSFDVGMDCHNFEVLSIDEVMEIFEKQ